MIILDGGGVTGYIMYYSFVIALMGSTLLVFIYLWRKDRLDMSEEIKIRMLLADEDILEPPLTQSFTRWH